MFRGVKAVNDRVHHVLESSSECSYILAHCGNGMRVVGERRQKTSHTAWQELVLLLTSYRRKGSGPNII